MLNNKTTRRGFLKATAQVPGGAVLASSAGWVLAGTPEEKQQAQIEFMSLVLEKYTLTSKSVQPEDIAEFTNRFAQQYGVVPYRAEFGGIPGEARLVRLFVQHRHPGIISFKANAASKA